MDLASITVQEFKDHFYRDFNYGAASDAALKEIPANDLVQDRDIAAAFTEAQCKLNQALFGTDAKIRLAYLLLSAHCLCNILKSANMGYNAAGMQPVVSRSVSGDSETYGIPEQYLKNPQLAQFVTTSYGLRYMQLGLSAATGNVVSVQGGTRP